MSLRKPITIVLMGILLGLAPGLSPTREALGRKRGGGSHARKRKAKKRRKPRQRRRRRVRRRRKRLRRRGGLKIRIGGRRRLRVRRGRFGGTLVIQPRVVRKPIGTFFGMQVGGPSVVAVIDRSGSMTSKTKSPELGRRISKMAMARRELARFLSSLDPSVLFDLRTFNRKDSGLMNKLMPATKKNLLTAKLWMQTVPVTGGTVIIRSLRRALSSGAVTILLLSDGMPNSSSEPSRILRMVRRAHRQTGVVINVVGVGMTQNNRLLSSIAKITGGAYVVR